MDNRVIEIEINFSIDLKGYQIPSNSFYFAKIIIIKNSTISIF